MRVVTWNINSVRLRINSVKKVVKKLNPDILCLQETKCLKEDFPFKDFEKMAHLNCLDPFDKFFYQIFQGLKRSRRPP